MAVTIYGVCALTFMMGMYALEGRGRIFVLAFALGCALSSSYGFLSGACPRQTAAISNPAAKTEINRPARFISMHLLFGN